MPTPWTYPTIASQFCETDNHIPWIHDNESFIEHSIDLTTRAYEINQIKSAKDLLHISNTLVQDIRMKTYYLLLTGFNWTYLPRRLSGIQARINIQRVGRITDDTIQLYQSIPVSDNKADALLDNEKTYGSETDLWGTVELTPTDLVNSEFGILLRYQSHPAWPHKATPNMSHVQLRVW
jgi:hypothetical protein